ncbi:MAG TPA: hypothetical protein DDY98_06340, partial [Ruminococcaceae bacterium]|nr:hypothetical protein [Oscillospiraceae bacterium]
MDMNVGPIKQMMENMGITEDDIDDLDSQMTAAFEGLDEGSFENGGAPTFPFFQGMMGEKDDLEVENG